MEFKTIIIPVFMILLNKGFNRSSRGKVVKSSKELFVSNKFVRCVALHVTEV